MNAKQKLSAIASGTLKIHEVISLDGIYYDKVRKKVISINNEVGIYRNPWKGEDVSKITPFSVFEKLYGKEMFILIPHDGREEF